MVSQFWFSCTRWNLLQFVTMPSCTGTGVATPFSGAVLVLVAVVGGRVVGGIVDVGGRVMVDWEVVLLDAVVGGGSDVTSTQYERPPWSVPQSSGIDGFFGCCVSICF